MGASLGLGLSLGAAWPQAWALQGRRETLASTKSPPAFRYHVYLSSSPASIHNAPSAGDVRWRLQWQLCSARSSQSQTAMAGLWLLRRDLKHTESQQQIPGLPQRNSSLSLRFSPGNEFSVRMLSLLALSRVPESLGCWIPRQDCNAKP